MISALAWIPRGTAATVPHRVKVDPALVDDLHSLSLSKSNENEDSKDENPKNKNASHNDNDNDNEKTVENDEDARIIKEFNLEDYDDDESDPEDSLIPGQKSAASYMFYKSNAEDPNLDPEYIAKHRSRADGEDHDDAASLTSEEEDIDDYIIRPTDMLFVAARNEEDQVSSLEVYLYEPTEQNLYVHHDLMMPVFPLCLAYVRNTVNMVAVGSFLPGIELWPLDVLDAYEPSIVLGGTYAQRGQQGPPELDDDQSAKKSKSSSSKKGGKSKEKKQNPAEMTVEGSHQDAVMSLAWNQYHTQILASGSADSDVKLWDISTGACLATLASAHTSKVQALAWHPSEASILLSAAYDRTAVVSDARSPLEASMRVSIGGDAEAVLWSGESTFMVATERGHVLCYDVRNSKKALYTLDAHDGKACSTLSMHKGAPGLLVTGGIDGVVKVWDVSSKPSLMTSRNVSIGNVFVASQAFDDPFLLAIGGSQGIVSLWNLLDTKVVAHKYGREAVPSVQIQYNSKDGDESEDELGAGGDGEDEMQD